MRKPGASCTLIGRTYVVPNVHRHERQAVILVKDHIQTVFQFEFLVLNLRQRLIGRDCRLLRARIAYAWKQDRKQQTDDGDKPARAVSDSHRFLRENTFTLYRRATSDRGSS